MPRSVASIARTLAAAGATWALASQAGAHSPPFGRTLLWASEAADASPAIVVSSRGLVFADRADGATAYSLRCYEAYGGGITEPPGVFLDAQGALTIGVFDAIRATADRACTFEPSAGLPDGVESLGVVTQDSATASRLFVASRSFDKRAALYVSEDYGRSWSARFENRVDDYFHALLPAPSDPLRLYAAGRRVDRAAQKLVYFAAVSLDGGESWEDHVLPSEIIPFAVHPRDPNVVFAYEPTNVLETEYRILRSDDRGANFLPVIEGLPMPTALAGGDDAATLWLGAGKGGLYRSSDAGRHFEKVHGESVQMVTCLAYRHERLWMCANMAPNTDGVWFSDDQGGSFQTWMVFAEVTRPVACEDSEAQAVCAAAWYDFDSELHPRSADAGADAGDADAGDAAPPPAGEDAAPPPAGEDAASTSQGSDAVAGGDAAPSRARARRSSDCQSAPGRPAGAASWWLWLGLAALIARARRRTSAAAVATRAAEQDTLR